MDLGEVKARLVADTTDFVGGLQKGQAALMAFQAGSVAVGELAAQAFVKLAEGAIQAATAAVRWTAEAGKAAEETEQLSMRIGIAASSLEGWSVAMARVGLSQESLAQGFRTLSKEMVDLQNKDEKSILTFQRLGVSMDQIEAVGTNTEQMIRLIADRFKEMPDGAEKSRLAIELFGRAGLQLIPILNKGSAGLDEARQKAIQFGLVLSDTQRTSLSAYDDALDDLGKALQGFRQQVALAFAPALTEIVQRMVDAVKFAKDIFNGFADAGEKLTIRIGAMAAALKVLSQQLFSFSVFSKEAWKQTLDQVKAIDDWAAAQIKAVDATRNLTEAQKASNAEAVKSIQHQKILGEQIVAYTQNQNKQREELSKTIFMYLEEADRIRLVNEQLSKPPTTGPFIEAIERKEAAVKNLMNLMPELTRDEAIALAARNYEEGTKQLSLNTEAWRNRHNELQIAVDDMKTLDAQQQVFYRDESGMLEASDAARRIRFGLIEAEGALERRVIQETIANEEMRNAKLRQLDIQLQTRRIQAIQQFPTVYEKQLHDLVSSNTFSISQITTAWTSGFAHAIVNAKSFGSAMVQIGKQTATTLLQGVLNFGVQELAQYLLQKAKKTAIGEAMQLALTAQTAAGEAARAGIVMASNKAISASITTTLIGMASVGNAAMGILEAVIQAVSGFLYALAASVAEVPIVGQALAGSLIVGATLAEFVGNAAVIAGTAAINTAVGSAIVAATTSLAKPMADGGLVTKPTFALIGEAGPEVVTPLDKMGRMGGQQTIIFEVDGKAWNKLTVNQFMSTLRLKGLPAW